MPPESAKQRTRLVVVGEAPGANEIEARKPFVGRSGQMLERGLATIGLKRSDVHWTNAILCQCTKDDLPAAAKACRRRLHEELAQAAAPAIMPVGAWGLRSVLKPKSSRIIDWRGSISALAWKRDPGGKLQAFNVSEEAKQGALREDLKEQPRLPSGASFSYVLPTLHPAFVMRSPEWAEHLEIDVARVGRILHSSWVAPEHESGRQLLICEKNLEPLDALQEAELATDVETPMDVRVMLAPLVCFVISDTRTSVIVPWSRDLLGRVPHWQQPQEIARKLTAFWENHVAVTHNGFAFDRIIFNRYGISFKKQEDTLVAAHAIASHIPKRLNHVATWYLDVPAWKSFEHGSSIQRMWQYCGTDGLYTALIRKEQREELE